MGKTIRVPRISTFRSEETGRDLSARFDAGVAKQMPFGRYRIEAEEIAYYGIKRYVDVYQHQITIMPGLVPGFIEANPVPLKVHGLVKLEKTTAGSIVKAVGLFADSSQEVKLDSSGQFSFSGLVYGKYLLLVLSGARVVAQQAVEVPYSGPPIRIEAPKLRRAPSQGMELGG